MENIRKPNIMLVKFDAWEKFKTLLNLSNKFNTNMKNKLQISGPISPTILNIIRIEFAQLKGEVKLLWMSRTSGFGILVTFFSSKCLLEL